MKVAIHEITKPIYIFNPVIGSDNYNAGLFYFPIITIILLLQEIPNCRWH